MRQCGAWCQRSVRNAREQQPPPVSQFHDRVQWWLLATSQQAKWANLQCEAGFQRRGDEQREVALSAANVRLHDDHCTALHRTAPHSLKALQFVVCGGMQLTEKPKNFTEN